METWVRSTRCLNYSSLPHVNNGFLGCAAQRAVIPPNGLFSATNFHLRSWWIVIELMPSETERGGTVNYTLNVLPSNGTLLINHELAHPGRSRSLKTTRRLQGPRKTVFLLINPFTCLRRMRVLFIRSLTMSVNLTTHTSPTTVTQSTWPRTKESRGEEKLN